MKKYILFFLVSSSLAQAANILFDLRFESDSATYNNAATIAGQTPSSAFLMKTGYLDYRGQLNEEVFYRLRWRFDKDGQTTVNKTDGFTAQVDHAYIQQKLMEGLQLTLGKFGSEIGSIEGTSPVPDNYFQSQVYRQMSAHGFIYVTGVKMTVNVMDHEGSLYIINQSETTSTDQTKNAYGLMYRARLMNHTIIPVFGYLKDEKQSLAGLEGKKSTTITSMGVKWEPKPYYLNLDYLLLNQNNVVALDEKDSWNSMIAEFGYDMDGFIPKVKYEMSQKKVDTASSISTKYDAVSLALEYKPYVQELIRYHLAVAQLTTKPDTGDSLFEQHFIIGARITADLLK